MAAKISIPAGFNGISLLTKNEVTGGTSSLGMEALLTQLLTTVNGMLEQQTRSQATSLSLAMALMSCSYLISPRSLAAILGRSRVRNTPPKSDPPFILDAAGLPAQAESDPLVLSSSADDGLPRVFVFDVVRLDAGTSFNDISLNIYVGDQLITEFDGVQLDPTTDNSCVSRALCSTKVCVGALQDISIRVQNDSALALGAGASIRINGRVAFPGDKDFIDCWAGACNQEGITAKVNSACSCAIKAGGDGDGWSVSEPPM